MLLRDFQKRFYVFFYFCHVFDVILEIFPAFCFVLFLFFFV